MYECVRKLGEIASPKGGSGFPKKYQGKKEGQYPFFKVSDMNLAGNEIYMNHAANYVDDADLAAMKAKVYPAGTIVFPKIGGAISTNKKRLLTCDAIFDNNVMGVVPNAGISSEYIYKFFVSLDLYDLSNKAALPSITASSVSELEIPLPPIPEQQRIVAILDQAFADIEKARANAEKNLKNARELFDSYLNQVFSQRGEGWINVPFSQCFKLTSGNSLTSKNMIAGDFPVYGGNEIAGMHNEFNLQGDNVIIGRVGALCGNARYIQQKIWLTDNAFKIVDFKYNFDNTFLTYLLNFKKLRNLARQAAQPVISNSSLKDLALDFPISIEEQRAISRRADWLFQETRKLTNVYINKQKALDELKKSLLQKAFSGELTKTEGHAA